MKQGLPKRLPLVWRDSAQGISPVQRIALGLLMLLLSGLAVLLAYQWRHYQQSVEEWQALTRLHAPVARTPDNPMVLRTLNEQTRALNNAIRHLNLPWDQVLEALRPEEVDDVVVLGLDTDAGGETLRVHAEAQHSEAMTAYVQALDHHPRFKQAMLSKHEQSERFGMRYRFTVELLCAP